MKTKFIEATDGTNFNWGKFAVCRFDLEEWGRPSTFVAGSLLRQVGWTPQHTLVLDLQTGEGSIFLPGGAASFDLNDRHQIWVCPMFEPFLQWLYGQNLDDLDALPAQVNLGDVPTEMRGYRRQRLEPVHEALKLATETLNKIVELDESWRSSLVASNAQKTLDHMAQVLKASP